MFSEGLSLSLMKNLTDEAGLFRRDHHDHVLEELLPRPFFDLQEVSEGVLSSLA